MKRVAPDYYKDFACIKGDCRHSCCVGWEIDIDEDSLEYYRSMDGEIGGKLRENIEENEEGAHFKLASNDRCPFLNADGLCDLIIELGEDCLCQICDDHPRFRNFYSDREEIGLGLCCEAAAKLILGRKDTAVLETMEDDGENESLFEEEAHVLGLRDALIALAQDRRFSMEERISKLLSFAGIELAEIDFLHWEKFLLKLERLDESWEDALEKLGRIERTKIADDLETAYEQLIVYLLFRHICADDDDLSGRIAYCALIWKLISKMHGGGDFEQLCDLARLYSSEIEYSDENMDAIICEIHRINPQI